MGHILGLKTEALYQKLEAHSVVGISALKSEGPPVTPAKKYRLCQTSKIVNKFHIVTTLTLLLPY